jgi:ubiquinone/menaquinone biosynthesis C-methylase UbiE
MTRTEPHAATQPSTTATGPATAIRANQDRLARRYAILAAPFARHARVVALRLLGARPGERVLEIGCGSGATLRDIARSVGPAGTVVGIDPSPAMAARAAQRVARAGAAGWTRVMVIDTTPLPLDDRAFDAVYLGFTLEAVHPETARAALLRECRRVTVRGGRMVCAAVSSRDPASPASRLYRLARRHMGSPVDDAPTRVADLAAAAGFTVVARLGLRLWGLPVDVVEGVS